MHKSERRWWTMSKDRHRDWLLMSGEEQKAVLDEQRATLEWAMEGRETVRRRREIDDSERVAIGRAFSILERRIKLRVKAWERPNRKNRESGGCVYRTSDGISSFLGTLIGEDYNKGVERLNWRKVAYWYLPEYPVDFLAEMQLMHDSVDVSDRRDGNDWKRALKSCRESWLS